jgi:hypothetical protein
VFEDRWPLIVRALWAIGGVTVLGAAARALDGRSGPVRAVMIAMVAMGWGLGLVAVLVPHPIGLTVLRLIATSEAAAGIWAALERQDATTISAACLAVLTVAVVHSAATGEWCVDGPAYPNEARFPLRPPAVHLWLTVPILGALTIATVLGGPLLLAARSWVGGGIVSALAIGSIVVGGRSLHQLSRRFVVFVPAGFVVHDHLVLREPVLFRRALIEGIRLTPADSDTLDLTAGASGLSIDVLLEEKVEITRLSADRRSAEIGSTAMFRVAPSRPGRLLDEATRRRYPTR